VVLLEVEVGKKAFGLAYKLGGPGLLFLGIIDSSAIPTFGGLDILLVVLCAAQPDWWWYYALFALAGSVVGAWLTYRLARKGGEAALEKRFPPDKIKKVFRAYDEYGFWAVFVPSILPPPFPTSPFLVAAGALKYSFRHYMVAVSTARILRYAAFAMIGAYFGRHVVGFVSAHRAVLIAIATALALVIGAAVGYFSWRWHEGRKGAGPERKAA
jgi:membrane protein YqaA with SNARE-associated domain